MITGTGNVFSIPPLVIHVAFGNFRRLTCCFTDCILQLCLTCNNGFINMENNFVLFLHKINLFNMHKLDDFTQQKNRQIGIQYFN